MEKVAVRYRIKNPAVFRAALQMPLNGSSNIPPNRGKFDITVTVSNNNKSINIKLHRR
jgi:hypothetical protein